MALTKSIPVVVQSLVDLVQSSAVPSIVDRVDDVYYGEQRLIPRFPAIVVEALPKDRGYANTRQYSITFGVSFLILWGSVDGTAEINRKEVDQKAEALEDILHTDKSLGGLLIRDTGRVTRIEPRVNLRGAPKIRASRLTWMGESREVLS